MKARSLFLNHGFITATSASGEGGNINLQVGNTLILRNSSQISTRAGTQHSGGGNGGNITINGGFIIAVPKENSDINANAFQGNGGNITINTPGLFGIQFRNQQTDLSDITATSQFGINGTVNLNLRETDITSTLVQLPEELIDPSKLIVAGCPTNQDANFTITGRGGLPEDPRQMLLGEVVLQDLRSPVATARIPVHHQQSSVDSQPPTIVEAKGWIVNPEGQIELVANNTFSRGRFSDATVDCSSLSKNAK